MGAEDPNNTDHSLIHVWWLDRGSSIKNLNNNNSGLKFRM